MPLIVKIDCPHCHTKSSGFQVEGGFRRSSDLISRRDPAVFIDEDWFLLSCGRCKKCITAQYISEHNSHRELKNVLSQHGSLEDIGYTYKVHFPSEVTLEEPEHLPSKVASPFRQAISNISAENWDAAGTMVRKALDVATRDMARTRIGNEKRSETIVKLWLKKRIEALTSEGLLTVDLSDLAGVLKDGGDEAAHDDEPYSKEDAIRLVGYAQAFLTYAYTVPGMVAEVRERVEDSPSSNTGSRPTD
ncbi:DUF4145 domain-containing protein [Afifella sp. YEN Y35]|uniref:DUF4145 domain-containing protein n=1 Tax=Afifella sp. YEN Y35 TaxID=3388337 RepID=UPI0039E10118